MSTATYDVVVIGGGPGGYVAAIRAAQRGMRSSRCTYTRRSPTRSPKRRSPPSAERSTSERLNRCSKRGDISIEPTRDLSREREWRVRAGRRIA